MSRLSESLEWMMLVYDLTTWVLEIEHKCVNSKTQGSHLEYLFNQDPTTAVQILWSVRFANLLPAR